MVWEEIPMILFDSHMFLTNFLSTLEINSILIYNKDRFIFCIDKEAERGMGLTIGERIVE